MHSSDLHRGGRTDSEISGLDLSGLRSVSASAAAHLERLLARGSVTGMLKGVRSGKRQRWWRGEGGGRGLREAAGQQPVS